MLRLLNDIAVDSGWPVDDDNPLRQVIINTHSPSVVAQLRERADDGHRYKRVVFGCLPDTWRSEGESSMRAVARGELLAYLNPNAYVFESDGDEPDRSLCDELREVVSSNGWGG